MAHMMARWKVPAGYATMRISASGRKGATRWSLYRAPTEEDKTGWMGDIVHFMPEDVWSAQPSLVGAKDSEHLRPQDAFAALVESMK